MANRFKTAFQNLLGAALLFVAAPCAAQVGTSLASGCPSREAPFPSVLSFAVYPVDGYRILVVAGGIDVGDADRLQSFLRTAGRVDEVWLDSPGGAAAEGPLIGRVLRRARLATRVPAGFECHSSCTFAFLGGVVRNVDPGGAYGVHTFYVDSLINSLFDIMDEGLAGETTNPGVTERRISEFLHSQEQRSALLAADLQIYAQEMGVARSFMRDQVFSQQSLSYLTADDIEELRLNLTSEDEIRKKRTTLKCLDRATLLRYNVVNVE